MKYIRICYLPVIFFIIFIASASCGGGKIKGGKRDWERERARMVEQLRRYGIKDKRVLAAMNAVHRHLYIPPLFRVRCDPYGDHPCPIGHGQTISQPYIVAHMTEHLDLNPEEKILEIGTGSGYQAAVLAELGVEVYSIEIVPELAEHARGVLQSEGYRKVRVLTGDGYQGWPEHSPFDAIIVTCAPEEIPPLLIEQLKDGGRMILPLGTRFQRLVIVRKRAGKLAIEEDIAVRFVPMVHGGKKSKR